MKINWLLESDIYGDDIKGLIEEIKRQGHGLKILSDRNYLDTKWLDLFDYKDCVVYYGGLELGYEVRRKAPWIPGIYSSVENYACTKYSPIIGPHWLNSCYMMLPYGDLLTRKAWIYKKMGIDDAVFIRPNKGTKVFTGKLVYKENFHKDIDLMGVYNVQPDELCVICEPRNVRKEWRFLVIDNNIVTGSQYKPDKVCCDICSIYDDSAIAYRVACEVLERIDYTPDRAWTLDICMTERGNFYVLEVGCFSCAGLYAMNFETVVREISRIALEDWKEIYEN